MYYQLNKGPQLSIDDASYDAGVIRKFGIVKHVFKLRNVGSKPLKIIDAKATCSCVVTDISNQTILPGGNGELPVEVKVATIGRKTEQIRILTNEKNNTHILSVSVDCQPLIHVSPETQNITLGLVPFDSFSNKQFKIYAFTQLPQEIMIDSLKTSSPDIQVKLIRSSIAEHRTTAGYLRKEFDLSLKVPTDVTGEYTDTLKISFIPAELPELSIPVSWEVGDRWEVVPEKIIFLHGNSGLITKTKKIIINCINGNQIESFRVMNPDQSHLRITPSQTDGAIELQVESMQLNKVKDLDLSIELFLKLYGEDEQLVRIPVKVISMEAP
jgi:hypothetical protein